MDVRVEHASERDTCRERDGRKDVEEPHMLVELLNFAQQLPADRRESRQRFWPGQHIRVRRAIDSAATAR